MGRNNIDVQLIKVLQEKQKNKFADCVGKVGRIETGADEISRRGGLPSAPPPG
jgi:hypothetical protein